MAMITDRSALMRMEFPLTIESDWPPVSVETLWVAALGDGHFRIDNIPFFVRDIAVDDVVVGKSGQGGLLRFVRKFASGGHSTIWVISHDQEAQQSLRPRG